MSDTEAPTGAQSMVAGNREEDAIYQRGQQVGRAVDPEIDDSARQVRFSEIHNSDNLLLPDECEFRSYRIVIRKIAYATKVEKENLHKGRILQGVTAEILGRREQ